MYQNENTSNEAGAEGGILVVANHWRWVVFNTAAQRRDTVSASGSRMGIMNDMRCT